MFSKTLLLVTSLLYGATAASSQDYKLNQLNQASIEQLHDNGLRLDLNLMRLDNKFLTSDSGLRYFVLLNNCKFGINQVDPKIVRALDNELDYPKISTFYLSNAPSILAQVPKTIILTLNVPASLGPYNSSSKTFPVIYQGGPIELHNVTANPDLGNVSRYCVDASRQRPKPPSFPNSYQISFSSGTSISELPMDEASARKYIESSNSNQRGVSFEVVVEILNGAPQISVVNASVVTAYLNGQIDKVTIVKRLTGERLGVAYTR